MASQAGVPHWALGGVGRGISHTRPLRCKHLGIMINASDIDDLKLKLQDFKGFFFLIASKLFADAKPADLTN